MGFPKVLAHRLRYTKGTKFFYYRNYFALAGVVVVSAIGYCFRYTSYIQDYRRELEEGKFDNSPEFEKRKITMGFSPMLTVTSSQDILRDQKEVREFSEPIRAGDLN